MAHFGVLSYKGSGHLNPLMALSRQLTARGHRVTFFLHPELEQRIRQHGLEFYPLDVPYSLNMQKKPKHTTRVGQIRTALHRIGVEMGAFLSAYSQAIQATSVDTLIMGEISLTGPTIAEILQLPYFVVSTSIPHNFGWKSSFTAHGSLLDRLQREILEVSILRMNGPVRWKLDQYRRRLGLRSIRMIGESHPELAHITQWPKCLDLRREVLTPNFFYTGPFVDEALRESIPFPWEQLDGRPLVYASLGTTRKIDPTVFARIAQACHELNLQLVITLGGRRDPASFSGLSGDPVVVRNAPQLLLLKRAQVIVTHAGPNTVLETLMQGKPMVALPVRLDQPAVATRLHQYGVAEVLRVDQHSAEEIHAALVKVCSDPRYRKAAERLQKELRSLSGSVQAADIIEDRLRGMACHRQQVENDLPVTAA
jgi:MGT family glycosyltransferase